MSRKKEIDPEHYFSLCTGGLIKDIKELVFALDYLSDEELNNHVNESKNDFSNWVRDVFQENKLAEEISEIQDRKDIQLALLKHIVSKKR